MVTRSRQAAGTSWRTSTGGVAGNDATPGGQELGPLEGPEGFRERVSFFRSIFFMQSPSSN